MGNTKLQKRETKYGELIIKKRKKKKKKKLRSPGRSGVNRTTPNSDFYLTLALDVAFSMSRWTGPRRKMRSSKGDGARPDAADIDLAAHRDIRAAILRGANATSAPAATSTALRIYPRTLLPKRGRA